MNAVDKATQTMIQNLREKTGKSLEEWIEIARKTGIAKNRELINHLKTDHGLTHGYANLIAIKALETTEQSTATGDDLVAAQYAGARAELRPIYDAIISAVEKFGKDVEISPKKAYVSLRRSKQFALVQPTTATRVDVGINLKGVEPTDRLEKSGSFNAMVSHRVRVSSKNEVDKELIDWLKKGYESA